MNLVVIIKKVLQYNTRMVGTTEYLCTKKYGDGAKKPATSQAVHDE
jgi:hypothetical protein